MKNAYAKIDAQIASLDIATVTGSIGEQDLLRRALTVFVAVRPLLFALSSLKVLPPTWRKALSLLIKTLDHLLAGKPDFKMGKDL